MFEITVWRIHVVALVGLLLTVVATSIAARGEPSVDRIATLRRLSILSGLVLVGAAVAGPSSLHELGLLAGVAVLVVVNHRWNLPLAIRSLASFRRLSWFEVGLVGAAVASLALFADTVEAPPGAAPAGVLSVGGRDIGATVQADVTIDPGFPGANTFTVQLADLRHGRPLPASAPAPRLRFEFLDDPGVAPSNLDLVPTSEPGVYRTAGRNVSTDGRWRLTVSVTRAGGTAEIRMETVSRCRPQDATGDGPLRGSVSPGRSGGNEIRATFLDGQGREVALDGDPTIRISTTGHPPLALSDVRRDGPGGAVVSTGLAAGLWRIDVSGGANGHPIRACFTTDIRPASPM